MNPDKRDPRAQPFRDLGLPKIGSWDADVTRRHFLQQAAGGLAAASAVAGTPSSATQTEPVQTGTAVTIPIVLQVNGKKHELKLDPRVTLLDALREHLGLTGSKKGCDHGQCGACTVLVSGRRIYSCLTLAVMQAGAPITTIEGLAEGDMLHPLQDAFIKHDAFQCGYCTSGQICSGVGLMQEQHAHSDAEIREQMSGNLCRCGAYPNIVAAIRETQAAQKANP